MKLDWDPVKQEQFDRVIALVRFVNKLTPSVIRAFPFNLLLHDLDWRIRSGRPLV